MKRETPIASKCEEVRGLQATAHAAMCLSR